jgi:hypothetical protein
VPPAAAVIVVTWPGLAECHAADDGLPVPPTARQQVSAGRSMRRQVCTVTRMLSSTPVIVPVLAGIKAFHTLA